MRWPAFRFTRRGKGLYKISPLPVRTVTTADKTAASSRLVTNRVRNLPSIVTVPTCGSSQRRWTASALMRASEQASGSSVPDVVRAKVTRASGRRLKPVNRKPFTEKE